MFNSIGFIALYACFAFVVVALLADWEATRQIAHSRFRLVPLIRLCRSAWGCAALMAGFFLGVGLASAPLPALLALLLAFLVMLVFQGHLLDSGAVWQASFRSFFPVALVLCFVANVALTDHPYGARVLSFGWVEAALALTSAVGFWLIAELRTQQDLLKLRD